MLRLFWAIVLDVGSTLTQHWANASWSNATENNVYFEVDSVLSTFIHCVSSHTSHPLFFHNFCQNIM